MLLRWFITATVVPTIYRALNSLLAEGPGTSIFTLVGVVLYLGYRIDRNGHAENMEALATRSQQR